MAPDPQLAPLDGPAAFVHRQGEQGGPAAPKFGRTSPLLASAFCDARRRSSCSLRSFSCCFRRSFSLRATSRAAADSMACGGGRGAAGKKC